MNNRTNRVRQLLAAAAVAAAVVVVALPARHAEGASGGSGSSSSSSSSKRKVSTLRPPKPTPPPPPPAGGRLRAGTTNLSAPSTIAAAARPTRAMSLSSGTAAMVAVRPAAAIGIHSTVARVEPLDGPPAVPPVKSQYNTPMNTAGTGELSSAFRSASSSTLRSALSRRDSASSIYSAPPRTDFGYGKAPPEAGLGKSPPRDLGYSKAPPPVQSGLSRRESARPSRSVAGYSAAPPERDYVQLPPPMRAVVARNKLQRPTGAAPARPDRPPVPSPLVAPPIPTTVPPGVKPDLPKTPSPGSVPPPKPSTPPPATLSGASRGQSIPLVTRMRAKFTRRPEGLAPQALPGIAYQPPGFEGTAPGVARAKEAKAERVAKATAFKTGRPVAERESGGREKALPMNPSKRDLTGYATAPGIAPTTGTLPTLGTLKLFGKAREYDVVPPIVEKVVPGGYDKVPPVYDKVPPL